MIHQPTVFTASRVTERDEPRWDNGGKRKDWHQSRSRSAKATRCNGPVTGRSDSFIFETSNEPTTPQKAPNPVDIRLTRVL